MGFRIRPLAATIALIFAGTTPHSVSAQTRPAAVLDDIVVKAEREAPVSAAIDDRRLQQLRPASSDSASLLSASPGLFVQGAGGVSGLPTLHGLADDRLRIKVDGMDLIAACANYMNPPLSYIDPNKVGSIQVYSGIAPVSAGGDAIGGTIIVNSAAPSFAKPGQGLLASGQLGAFYRSNSEAHGVNAAATVASENLAISYNGAQAEAKNYKAAKDFKPAVLATRTRSGNHWIAGDEVGSSAYRTENHALGVALRADNHLVDFKLGYQHIPEQGFPNQHMDMTGNESTQINLGYAGHFGWGGLRARFYQQNTRHQMDFAGDKLYWYGAAGNVAGMPMDTKGRTTGAAVTADVGLSARDLLKLGAELQRFRLDDWWKPVANSMMMSPNTFWNINNGQRDRFDLFAEWEAQWSPHWLTLAGIRGSSVRMDSGPVQGYNTGAGYAVDAARFNASDRQHSDENLDLGALARYTPDAGQSYDGGYARKTRSPSLYERYTWSTNGMAMTMNNWLNDGNGYLGDVNLKPEVAHTLSLSADWHDAGRENWGLRLAPFFSHVDNYIDAACAPGKTCNARQFVYLKLVNQDARLFGADLAGFVPIAKTTGAGNFTARATLAYVNGKNRETGDHLYNIMPLNARLAIEHRLGQWTTTVENQLVGGKRRTSQVRNEMETAGYGLLNLRSSYEAKHLRIDIGLENALDKHYSSPLGGAYIGQGATMSLNGSGAPYGLTVPGMGRSLYAAVNLRF
ncbi:MAG TPA: TonB-dependent receptor [Azonexus sp.]|nr:TonB-dependent receptor [Azonexus sp.]